MRTYRTRYLHRKNNSEVVDIAFCFLLTLSTWKLLRIRVSYSSVEDTTFIIIWKSLFKRNEHNLHLFTSSWPSPSTNTFEIYISFALMELLQSNWPHSFFIRKSCSSANSIWPKFHLKVHALPPRKPLIIIIDHLITISADSCPQVA